MKVKNLTSEQWKLNHDPDHDDKWCRELYPFHVFEKIDFDSTKVGKEQRITMEFSFPLLENKTSGFDSYSSLDYILNANQINLSNSFNNNCTEYQA